MSIFIIYTIGYDTTYREFDSTEEAEKFLTKAESWKGDGDCVCEIIYGDGRFSTSFDDTKGQVEVKIVPD